MMKGAMNTAIKNKTAPSTYKTSAKGGVAAPKPAPAAAPKPAPVAAPKPAPRPAAVQDYSPDRNLYQATMMGNEANDRAISSFNSTAENMTNILNQQSTALTGQTRGQLDNAYNRYNQEMRGYSDAMGTADQDIHTRNRGAAYAGLDSGFGDAGDELQASLARRGLSNAGIGAKAMGDLAQDRMRAGAAAGVNAYTSAMDMSDARRKDRMNTAGGLYGAEQGNINSGYQMGMGMLGQNYGNSMAVRGQALQNTLNNNQQRIGNLMGYAQLGRGMAGMSQNYLQQAGSGYSAIGGQAGQTAIGLGGLNNSYNATMQDASAKKAAKGGEALGAGLGMAGTLMSGGTAGAALGAFSDRRLKDNLKVVGEVMGFKVYTWDWNEEGKRLAHGMPEIGFIAQEVLELSPKYVHLDESVGYYKIDYGSILKGIALKSKLMSEA